MTTRKSSLDFILFYLLINLILFVLTILEINQLDKSFGPVHAVNNLSLKIESGQVFGILGPNGSGKTTTLAMVLGIIHADKGKYFWFGKPDQASQRRQIGTLIETPNFYPYLNLVQNLGLVCRIKEIDKSDIDRVLKIVDLYERRNSRFQTLSYGMKQRLVLASVMLGDPQVLVLDEPANGLDPEGIAEVREIIRNEARRGKTIIMASHILDEVEKVCTHVAILKKGKLLATGEVNSLIKGERVLIISSPDTEKLKSFLEDHKLLGRYTMDRNEFKIILKKEVDLTSISRELLENGIVISKLDEKKQSLEDQFLELVNQL